MMSTEQNAADLNDAEAYRNRGLEYGHQGKNAEAIADLTEALRLEPDHAWTYRCRASVYDSWASELGYKAGDDLAKYEELRPAME